MPQWFLNLSKVQSLDQPRKARNCILTVILTVQTYGGPPKSAELQGLNGSCLEIPQKDFSTSTIVLESCAHLLTTVFQMLFQMQFCSASF